MNSRRTKQITVNMVIKNEDQWVWFALQSVLSFVDRIIIFDTGSIDRTVEIIKQIKSPKIELYEKGSVDRRGLVDLRNEQISLTKSDWILLLDGDEIWPSKQLEKLISSIDKADENTVGFVNRTRNCIGDIFHYLPESAGKYEMAGKRGNLNLRLLRKTAELSISGVYPLESFTNLKGPIEKQSENLQFVDCWLLHTSFLQRSSMDFRKTSGSLGKRKIWEKGIKIAENELPEVFFKDYPYGIENPLKKRGKKYEYISTLTTPLINIKRKLK